jgi:8-oxo-dGTP diphosphatase
MPSSPDAVRMLVSGIVPADETERAHRRDALAWLGSTRDIYRRAKPATPPKHLVSYAVLLDPRDATVFLGNHVLAGLCLPPGGHVEPGEDPADTVRREAREELGIEADFSAAGSRPVFVTVTRTAGTDGRHTDVSLWYVISGRPGMWIDLDRREFTGGRWWTAADIESADPARFDPHIRRFIGKVRSLPLRAAGERPGTPG